MLAGSELAQPQTDAARPRHSLFRAHAQSEVRRTNIALIHRAREIDPGTVRTFVTA